MIPDQLHNGWRFVLVKPQTKEAFEKDWQNTANYAYDDPKLKAHLEAGGNYGVVAGDHVIIECDTSELEAIIEGELSPTFTQRSPGHHSKHFFFNGTSKTIPLFDKSKPKGKDNVGHVKSGPSYVVGPGSVHPNGGRYEVVDNRPIGRVTDEQVHKVLAQYVAQRALAVERTEARKQHAPGPDSFNILDLVTGLPLKQMGNGQLQGSHPIHGSETGMNFSVNPVENVWHCFRCNSGGGPYHLLAVLRGVIDCQKAAPGGLRGDLFKQTLKMALEEGLVERKVPVLNVNDETPELTEEAQPHEIAEATLRTLHIHSIFKGDTYVYNAGVYIPLAEAVIHRTVEDNFHNAGVDKTATNHFHNEVLGHIKRRTYTKPDIFDPDPHILNLENGLFNVDTYELKPHTPDYPSLAKLPIKYDPSADCPLWKRFVSQVLHPEDHAALQEFCGSLLVKNYKTQKAWLQVGEGANGKDTFDRVLRALLGPENVANRSLQDLENNRFAKADLFGKLANIYSDLSDVALKTTGSFKTLTGEGSLAAEKKFQNGFNFDNHAKLIFSCNKIPASPDDTDAFFRRWFITTFPNTFLGEKADPDLVAKLTTPEELSGILNWSLEGLRRLVAQNWRLSDSKSVEDVRQDYIRKSDPVKAFVLDCCIADPEGAAGKQTLFQAFIRYIGQKKLPPVTSTTFWNRLPMAGVPISSVRLGPRGKQVPSFKGLWLRHPENWAREVADDEKPVMDNETLTWTLEGRPLTTPATPATAVESVVRVEKVEGASPPKDEVELEPPFVKIGYCTHCNAEGKALRPSSVDPGFGVCQQCFDEQTGKGGP